MTAIIEAKALSKRFGDVQALDGPLRPQPHSGAIGALGCILLALTLPFVSVVSGGAVLAFGALAWLGRRRVLTPAR